MFKVDNYYLDISKVSELECKEERHKIHNYYMDMLHCISEKRDEMAKSLFHTLYNNGFLRDIREDKLNDILP